MVPLDSNTSGFWLVTSGCQTKKQDDDAQHAELLASNGSPHQMAATSTSFMQSAVLSVDKAIESVTSL